MEEDNSKYFKWLCGFVHTTDPLYFKLLRYLHERAFTPLLEMDENRVDDGMDLRFRFQDETGLEYQWNRDRSCSILEMMVALSIRCEEHIMDDPNSGNRTAQWFWRMIDNLGLLSMCDAQFDPVYVDEVIGRFLDRRYQSNGEGGLFTVERGGVDLRKIDIWYQAMWYLDSIM